MPTPDPNANQIGGSHYATFKFQHWDFVLDLLQGRYLEGCVSQYITRWRLKNGVEDLHKARHFLEKLISVVVDGGKVEPMRHENKGLDFYGPLTIDDCIQINNYLDEHKLETTWERQIFFLLCGWTKKSHLVFALVQLDHLIEHALDRPVDQL